MAFSVALTGGIASGKTTVAQLFAEHGAILIDSDALAREVVAPGTPGLAEIAARFGTGVLAPDGGLDRQALGEIIFGDERARGDLNAIIHPRVRQRRAEIISGAAEDAIVVSVIPLLVETGLAGGFDAVVVVDMPEELQIERLMARSGLTEERARARVDAQARRRERLAVAHWVIDNSGARAQLHDQVEVVWQGLIEAARSR